MRLLAVIIGLLLIAGFTYAARFDFTGGEPRVVEDGTVSDTLEQSRKDFTNGQPSIVFDATAVETAVTVSTAGSDDEWFFLMIE